MGHGGAWDPTSLTLVLLQAMFAYPRENQDVARRSLLEATSALMGADADATARMKILLTNTEMFAQQVAAECACSMGDAGEDPSDAAAHGDVEASDPSDCIRHLYRRYLDARSWPRKLAKSGDRYLPAASSGRS